MKAWYTETLLDLEATIAAYPKSPCSGWTWEECVVQGIRDALNAHREAEQTADYAEMGR